MTIKPHNLLNRTALCTIRSFKNYMDSSNIFIKIFISDFKKKITIPSKCSPCTPQSSHFGLCHLAQKINPSLAQKARIRKNMHCSPKLPGKELTSFQSSTSNTPSALWFTVTLMQNFSYLTIFSLF